jgi:hypothetical protein
VHTSFGEGRGAGTPIPNCQKGEIDIVWTYYLFLDDKYQSRVGDFNRPVDTKNDPVVASDGGTLNERSHKYWTRNNPILPGVKAISAESVRMKVKWDWCDWLGQKKIEASPNWKMYNRPGR